jgi:DNA polymerase gamma 1
LVIDSCVTCHGGGVRRHDALQLREFNPAISEADAKMKAEQLYAKTKGKRSHLHRKLYLGGSESAMFNELEAVANSVRARGAFSFGSEL